jgi:hypothetical protein
MEKLICRISAKLAVLIMISAILILSGCTASKGEGFAIYLTKGDIPPAQMPALSHIDIEAQPIIALSDIITYHAQTHEITLTAKAYENVSNLKVPVRGKSFVVCVNRKPIYWGAFWTPISSMSFDGITIWKPLIPQEPKVIKLELGYPSSSFYGGEDPRNNTEVMESLELAGKLNTMPSATTGDKLPHSAKGYELYSWLENSQWHFTLITGTNRNKSLEEIISDVNIVSEDGWVQIQMVGAEAIESVLSRLPQNEYVFWLAGMREEQTPQGSINITLPPRPAIDTIKEHAVQSGLAFQVPIP